MAYSKDTKIKVKIQAEKVENVATLFFIASNILSQEAII